jgi:hypothetical protein
MVVVVPNIVPVVIGIRDRLVESHYSSSRSYSKFNGGTRSPQSTLEKYDNYVDMDPDGMDWSEFTAHPAQGKLQQTSTHS